MTPTAPDHPRASSDPAYRRGPHWIAVFAAAFTWPLLISGGQVTTYRVGMAVPDWPTTFQENMFLYDFLHSSWGVFIEHRHRLFGSALGMTTIALAVWFLVADRRVWMKGLGVLALAAVIAQGLFGRNRILLNSTDWAAIHGASGQAVFALLVALAVLTGRDWLGGSSPRSDDWHFRRRAAVTLGLIYAQIAVGAWLRHFGTTAALLTHAVLATAVWGHAVALVARLARHRADVPELWPSARAMALIATLQVALGVAAWWVLRPFDGVPRPVSLLQAFFRTGHQANGALLLASSVVLTLRAFRHLVSPAREARRHPGSLEWEAVA